MTQGETKSVVESTGKWLAIASAALTVVLTALNAYWSHEVSKLDNEIKLKAADLDRQRLELDSGKERLARYAFVQKLLSDVLVQNSTQKNLTVNLIMLALTEQEAQQLFAGLQSSDSHEIRRVGTLGSDVAAVASQVLQMNDAVKVNRTGALQTLINKHRGNSAAVEQALLLIESPKLNELSASGRINVLMFLLSTDKIAWTQQSISKAERAIAQIRSRAKDGFVIGVKTDDALKQLSAHIGRLKS